MMRLRVRTLGSEEFEVYIDADSTIKELKQKIEEKMPRMTANKQKLVHAGKILNDNMQIKQYPDIKENERLVVLLTKVNPKP